MVFSGLARSSWRSQADWLRSMNMALSNSLARSGSVALSREMAHAGTFMPVDRAVNTAPKNAPKSGFQRFLSTEIRASEI